MTMLRPIREKHCDPGFNLGEGPGSDFGVGYRFKWQAQYLCLHAHQLYLLQ